MRITLLLIIYAFALNCTQGQEVGVKFDVAEAYIQHFLPGGIHDTLVIDYKKNNVYITEFVFLDANTLLFKNKKDQITKDQLRVGYEVSLEALRYRKSKKTIVSKLTLLTDIENDRQVFSGIIEKVDVDKRLVYISGYKIALKEGVKIKALKQPKNKISFDDNQVNSLEKLAKLVGEYAKGAGKRDADGTVQANQIAVWPDDDEDEIETDLIAKFDNHCAPLVAGLTFDPKKPDWYVKTLGKSFTVGDKPVKMVKDEKLVKYVNDVAKKIVPDHFLDDQQIHFYVVEDPTFNAYIYPNGVGFVNTGLLLNVSNEAQLAAVLGHEIGHVIYEHSARSIKKQQNREDEIEIFADILDIFAPKVTQTIGAYTGLPTSELVKLAYNIDDHGFEKNHEHEADRLGLFYVEQAGYDPREVAKIWKYLILQAPDAEDGQQNETLKTLRSTVKRELPAVRSTLRPGYYNRPSAGYALAAITRPLTQELKKDLDGTLALAHPKNYERFIRINYLVANQYSKIEGTPFIGEDEYATAISGLFTQTPKK